MRRFDSEILINQLFLELMGKIGEMETRRIDEIKDETEREKQKEQHSAWFANVEQLYSLLNSKT